MAIREDVIFELGVSGAAASKAKLLALGAAFVLLGRKALSTVKEFDRFVQVQRGLTIDIGIADRATRGLIDTMRLMQGASKLTAGGLEVTAEEYRKLAVLAVKYAQATGEATEASLDLLISALAGGRTFTLKTFGLELSESGSKAEVFAEAMKQISPLVEDVDVKIENASEGFKAIANNLDTAAANAWGAAAASNALVPSLEAVVDATSLLAFELENANDTMRVAGGSWRELTWEITKSFTIWGSVDNLLEKVGIGIDEVGNKTVAQIEATNSKIRLVTRTLAEANKVLEETENYLAGEQSVMPDVIEGDFTTAAPKKKKKKGVGGGGAAKPKRIDVGSAFGVSEVQTAGLQEQAVVLKNLVTTESELLQVEIEGQRVEAARQTQREIRILTEEELTKELKETISVEEQQLKNRIAANEMEIDFFREKEGLETVLIEKQLEEVEIQRQLIENQKNLLLLNQENMSPEMVDAKFEALNIQQQQLDLTRQQLAAEFNLATLRAEQSDFAKDFASVWLKTWEGVTAGGIAANAAFGALQKTVEATVRAAIFGSEHFGIAMLKIVRDAAAAAAAQAIILGLLETVKAAVAFASRRYAEGAKHASAAALAFAQAAVMLAIAGGFQAAIKASSGASGKAGAAVGGGTGTGGGGFGGAGAVGGGAESGDKPIVIEMKVDLDGEQIHKSVVSADRQASRDQRPNMGDF
jgi:hypothetical protein